MSRVEERASAAADDQMFGRHDTDMVAAFAFGMKRGREAVAGSFTSIIDPEELFAQLIFVQHRGTTEEHGRTAHGGLAAESWGAAGWGGLVWRARHVPIVIAVKLVAQKEVKVSRELQSGSTTQRTGGQLTK